MAGTGVDAVICAARLSAPAGTRRRRSVPYARRRFLPAPAYAAARTLVASASTSDPIAASATFA
jgi:hypothetical protein